MRYMIIVLTWPCMIIGYIVAAMKDGFEAGMYFYRERETKEIIKVDENKG